jgi:hypothetical protein
MELSLSANGTIVEAYAQDVKGLTSVNGSFTFGHAVVPEPTTALLLGLGLLAGWRASRDRL